MNRPQLIPVYQLSYFMTFHGALEYKNIVSKMGLKEVYLSEVNEPLRYDNYCVAVRIV